MALPKKFRIEIGDELMCSGPIKTQLEAEEVIRAIGALADFLPAGRFVPPAHEALKSAMETINGVGADLRVVA